MSRRRLLVSIFAVLYIGVLVWLTFVPAQEFSGLWSFLALLPVGALLLVLLTPHRWWIALGFGVLGAAWIEAAQSVWLPPGYASALDVLWGAVGAGVGVVLGRIALALDEISMHSHIFPSRMPQAGSRERPED